MQGLKSLKIKINNQPLVLEPLLFEPVFEIQPLGQFMIEVPNYFRVGTSTAKHISRKDGTIPFKIERGLPIVESPFVELENDSSYFNQSQSDTLLSVLEVLCCPLRGVVQVVRLVPKIVTLLREVGDKIYRGGSLA